MTVDLPRLEGAAWPAPLTRPAAPASSKAAPAPVTNPGLLGNGRFRSVLVLAFLGFAIEQTVRAVLPLLILARGGDAVLVGLMVGAFALPSIVFRPLVGRLADTIEKRTLLRAGGFAASILPLGLLLPGVGLTLAVRFLQGTAWSFYSVANQALMARNSPVGRRGEASGLYMMMPALAALIAPALAVALFHAAGEDAPFLVASGIGVAALAVALRLPPPPAMTVAAIETGSGRFAWLASLVEPSALPGMVLTITFGSATTLFSIFGPVYAATHGEDAVALLIYFAVFGLAQVIALPLGGRLSDRFGRRRSITLGTVVAAGSLLVAASGGMAGFSLGAVGYAVAAALVNPAISAMAIERAPRGRIGSAMATYSIGYQVANGISGVAWGLMIGALGYPWPFVVAVGLQLLTFGLVRRGFGSRRPKG
jgi:MFS family permease